jgi:hypothetical protein
LEPPWIKYPHIPLGSIGWRGGYGEVYWFEFKDWYRALNNDEKIAVQTQYPEPHIVKEGYPWTGFYDRLEN